MRWRCSIAWAVRRTAAAAAAASWLAACASLPAVDIAGLYRHEEPIAATLEVRAEAGQYVVRLEGGGSAAAGSATAADCVIEARGELDGAVLRAPFGPVETDTFSYSAAEAGREGRMVEIRFAPSTVEVVEADTLGYCGFGVEFTGRYRAISYCTDANGTTLCPAQLDRGIPLASRAPRLNCRVEPRGVRLTFGLPIDPMVSLFDGPWDRGSPCAGVGRRQGFRGSHGPSGKSS